MSQKGLATLRAYLQHLPASSLGFVVGARDDAVRQDYFDEIQELCTGSGVPFFERKAAPELSADYRFSISWRWLISDTQRLVILHDSLLPRYRGFAPLVNALINGEEQIGVTAIFAGPSYDTGPIIEQRSIAVDYPLTIAAAIETLTPLYAELVVAMASKIINGQDLKATEQIEADASYSLWRDEQDYRIDWHLPAAELRRWIDALGFPYQGASCWIAERKLRILQAEEFDDLRIENRVPGKVVFIEDDHPVVACGSGLIRLIKVVDDATGENVLPLKRFRTRFR